MKQYLHLILVCASLAGSVTVFGQDANRNPHNFNKDNWEYSERCNPCHVYKSETNSDLSNEYLISYESDSLSAADSSYLSGVSKICFACHDGSVAGFSHIANFEEGLSSGGVTKDHPVSVIYRFDSLKRNGLFNPEITMSGLGGTIKEDMLINGRIECTSCHDPHFSMHKTACKSCPTVKSDNVSSLLVENKKSALCLICHNI